MKGLICYDTRYGSTVDTCRFIRSGMKMEIDIKKVNEVDCFAYDVFIIGSPVFIGKPMRSVEEYIICNQDRLRNKNIAIFVTCWASATEYASSSQEFIEQLQKHLPPCNLISARALPGKLLLDKISERDRNVMERILRRLDAMSEEFDSERIAWRDARDKKLAEDFGREIETKLGAPLG